MRNIVNALLLSEDKVLLARRSSHRKSYPDLRSFPGGHVEENETHDQALCREASEELGIVPLNYYKISQISDPNTITEIIYYHLYVVTKWSGAPTIINNEHSELLWLPLWLASSKTDTALEQYRPVFVELRARLPISSAKNVILRA
jgi:8-oxo-dGTP diphosphatase